MWKRLICIVVLAFCTLAGSAQAFTVDSEVTNWPYNDGTEQTAEEAADLGKVFQEDAVAADDSAVQGILDAFGINYNTSQGEEQTATFFIKNLLNWLLAISGLVALVVLIVGFYKMFFASDNQEAHKEARKIVKGAAIAIVVIGVSWFLVSWVFDLYALVRDSIG